MYSKIYSKIISVLLITGIILLSGCSKQSQSAESHEEMQDEENHEEGHHDEGNEKTVVLNEAQFANAEIDTGWFEMKNINDVVIANGYTKLDPQDEADVSMPISGTIENIGVIEGDFVRKGSMLATMKSLEYNKLLLDRSSKKEKLAEAESHIIYLKQEFERQEKLADENISAQKTFEKISAELKTEEVKINALKEQNQILNQTIASIGQSGNEHITIKAPITGYITDVNVKIGSGIAPGNVLFSIVNNEEMHVDLLVYEKDLQKIKVGQTVRFMLTNQSNKEIKGEIYNIGQSFANDTKSVAVHADIELGKANLIPGMYVNALIDIGSNKVNALPEEAFVLAEGRDFVFVMEVGHHHEEHSEGGEEHHHEFHFRRVEVKKGASQLGYVEATPLEDIEIGERIVKAGAYYLQSHLKKESGGGGHHH